METTKQYTKKEAFLLTVAKYYNRENRAYISSDTQMNQCVYFDPVTKKCCAVGQMLEKPEKYKGLVGDVYCLLENNQDVKFKFEFQKVATDVGFLSYLQQIHDSYNTNDIEEYYRECFEIRLTFNQILEQAFQTFPEYKPKDYATN